MSGGGDIDLRQRVRVVLIFRLGLEDHAVLVRLPVDGRNLALAKGIAQGVDDGLHRDSKPAGGVAIDLDVQAEAVILRLRGDVLHDRRRAQLLRKLRRPIVDLLHVGAGERVLILRAAHARRDLDVLHRLKVDDHARDRGDRPLQPIHDRRHRRLALIARAQGDGKPAGIRRGIHRRHADHGHHAGDVGILADRGFDRGL